MKTILAALACGIVFGLGLSISEMINPARVIGFLDVAGEWDLTLMLVMGGALVVTLIGFPLITRRPKPVLAERFVLPTKTKIDSPLLSGGILFGIDGYIIEIQARAVKVLSGGTSWSAATRISGMANFYTAKVSIEKA